ncbi:MAG: hypothetical protein AB1512_00080 [Thermodesulfobacteriota bacterium]
MLAKEGVQFAFRLAAPDLMELEMASFKNLGGLPPTAFYAVLKRAAVGRVSQAEVPNLSGSWAGRCIVAEPDHRERHGGVHLDLVRQDGELLWMDNVWSPSGPVTSTTDPKSVLRERMIGSLNPAGTGGVLTKEGVRMGFRLLSPDRMEVEFIRMGGARQAPTAFYTVLRRGGEEPMAPPAKGIYLKGAWTGSYRWAIPNGWVDATSSLLINRHEGSGIWAEDLWRQPGLKDAASVRHRDPMAGGLSPDQTRGALAKPGACFTFRVLDAERLECAFIRIDKNPAAFRAVFTRKP